MTIENTSEWLGMDASRREAFERAVNTSNAGSVLLQTYINRVVQQLTLRELGLQAVLPRKPGQGNAAYINRRTAGATGGAWVADTDSTTEETGTYAQVSFTYRTAATRGQITRKIIATGRSYGDVLATEVAAKVEDFTNLLEGGLLTGDSGADANQIDGFLTLVNAVSAQVVAQTTASDGDDVTLAKLDEAIDLVKGSSNPGDLVIIGSFNGLRKVNNALQAQQRFVNTTTIGAGFRVKTYNDIPMIVSTSMPNDMTWATSTITDFANGDTTCLLILNMRHCWIEELTPTTVLPLARTTSQNEQFDVFSDIAAVYGNTLGGAILGGIAGS
jgi:HK97 family phage major capsid protein